ncbi:putative RDD family membrane protein YckC [Novosphingobium sp. PhB165]|uniref:RDD family protein n=1 Tax=Novosphingobium sp. PhB165 TaxID=2485105 RepID=UPI001046AAD8|nr:RDD family protein [Novosphingobium sp. PhB165]TCM17868.1 putative RDD family membrane protein YckC [Novosphingobium sp. PhB165]
MVPYGGFWWRVLAYFIDAVILYIAMMIVGMVFGIGMMSSMANLQADPSAMIGLIIINSIVSLILNWLYFAVLESSPLQGTIGKLAIGLVVTDLNGNRISFLRATGRYFAKILSSLILLIGYAMVGFTERKQGLHDIIASTLVYKTRDPREARHIDEGVFA